MHVNNADFLNLSLRNISNIINYNNSLRGNVEILEQTINCITLIIIDIIRCYISLTKQEN